MTDDFVLFPDAAGAGGFDDDIALVTAYLAGELSPVQILAVQDRLETDAAFRARVEPIIRAWIAPGARRPGVARHARARLLPIPAFLRASSTTTSNRSRTMKRVAAVIAIGVLPMVAVAQYVAFAAEHPGTPGHGIARWIFPQLPGATLPSSSRPLIASGDAPLAQPLAHVPQRTIEVTLESADQQQQQTTPTRARVAELVRQHQPMALRRDSADYVVLVVDSGGAYVWSTRGLGAVSIEAAGEPRGRGARVMYTTGYRDTAVARFSRRGGGDTTRFTLGYVIRDTSRTMASLRVIDRLADSTRLDSLLLQRRPLVTRDSTRRQLARDSGGYVVTLTRARVLDSIASPARVRYQVASAPYQRWLFNAGSAVNSAPGLRAPGGGQSGIEGLPSSSVVRADSHTFEAGALAPARLDVLVVRLAPGTTWRGR
jgi:hypothetical protein